MSVERKARRREQIEAKPHGSPDGVDDIRERLRRVVRRGSSEEALQRLIELAAQCVSEAVAWDAFADAQDVDAGVSWIEIQRLGREAHDAKQARIRIVNRLRSEMGE
jgi:hypothetical protein